MKHFSFCEFVITSALFLSIKKKMKVSNRIHVFDSISNVFLVSFHLGTSQGKSNYLIIHLLF